MRPGLLLAGAIVIVSNAFVLMGVARNRAGTPVETIQLTQLELPTGYHEKENTGVSLRMNWNRYGLVGMRENSWLSREKLEELGFDTVAVLHQPNHAALPRPAYVVLEYNGRAWEQWLRSAQENKFFNQTGNTQSRLVAIDASKDGEMLLQKYSDRQKYLIVRGVIRAGVNWGSTPNRSAYRLEGSVSELLPGTIHVAPPLSATFAKTPYSVTLNYGHRFEPWVSAQP